MALAWVVYGGKGGEEREPWGGGWYTNTFGLVNMVLLPSRPRKLSRPVLHLPSPKP
jgi:hypothetical protein